uniref:RING-type domain-containing protein n=1 Tax=Bionectria ochroleuca TaxID=29856 RepID=A0A8H7K7K3_BIOOC
MASKLELEVAKESWEHCTVCSEFKQLAAFPSTPTTSACAHGRVTCLPCLQASIAYDIAHKGVRTLACPECGTKMTYDDVVRHTDTLVRTRYEDLLLRVTLQEHDAFVWVSAPNPAPNIMEESLRTGMDGVVSVAHPVAMLAESMSAPTRSLLSSVTAAAATRASPMAFPGMTDSHVRNMTW